MAKNKAKIEDYALVEVLAKIEDYALVEVKIGETSSPGSKSDRATAYRPY